MSFPELNSISKWNTQPSCWDTHFSSAIHPGQHKSLYKPSINFYICLCAWVYWTASLRSADTSPVLSVRFSLTLQDHHSGEVTHFINILWYRLLLCVCVCEHSSSKGGAPRSSEFHWGILSIPGSLHNKQRSRLRRSTVQSITELTGCMYEMGWWRDYWEDKEETHD